VNGRIGRKTERTPADYARDARVISGRSDLVELRIAFLSSYTSEVLKPYVAVELSEQGYLVDQYFAPFNQFETEIHNSGSGFNQFKSDFIVIHMRIDDLYNDLLTRFAKYHVSELQEISDNLISRYRSILEGIRSSTTSKIIVFNFANDRMISEYFTSSPVTQLLHKYIQELNNSLYDLCTEMTSCFTLDFQQVITTAGLSDWEDLKFYYIAKIPFNSYAQVKIARTLARTVASINSRPIKCLVLDLDNTLWGGVIGEDGLIGIQLGNDYPGNIFKDFQRVLLGLRDQGVLLAIASKNNLEDVVDVFEKHTDCLLKMDDFSAIQVHWGDKATSVKEISKELNIGLDTIAFFDDNPVEREWVRDQLPEVKVINVSTDPIYYIQSLFSSQYFDQISLTVEDKERSIKYQQQKRRKILSKSSKSVDDFLQALKMKVNFGYMDEVTVKRVEQLVNKTNQFNLTTRRYTAADLEKIVCNNGMVLWVSVEDCYGDNGIVGVAIVENILRKEWVIDTFLLSCRIIGRKIETIFLEEIIEIARKNNAEAIIGQHIPNRNNGLVSEFYKDHSFKLINDSRRIWELKIRNYSSQKPVYISVKRVSD